MALKKFSFFLFKIPTPHMLWKKVPKKREKNIFSIFWKKGLWTFLDIFWKSVHFFPKIHGFLKKKDTTWL
jgi:hypothetical protein